MKRIGSIACLIILTILASCANSAPVPTADVVVTLNNPESEIASRTAGMSGRTMLPSELPEISTYTVILKEVEGSGDDYILTDSQPVSNNYPGSSEQFEFDNIRLGTYTVIVQGIGTSSDVPVVNGTSDDYLTVTANGANTVNVTLGLISENGESEYTGSVQMTFDWTDLAITNATIQEAMEDGGLVFILYRYDASSSRWVEEDRSEATGTDATTFTYKADGLPVSTGLQLKYALATADNVMLNPILTTPIAQIYSGLTSIQKGKDGSYVYVISENEISSATNVYDIKTTYEDSSVDKGEGIKFTWSNQMQSGECIFKTVTVICYDSTGKQVGETQTINVSGATGECIINGLKPGEIYKVTFQAHHKSGLVSPIYTYENVMAEVLVAVPEDVKATASTSSIEITWGKVENAETYTIYRSVNNGDFSSYITDITGTNYSDTEVVAGYTYSYKVQAIGKEIQSELSEATDTIQISGTIISITKPELKNDFEIIFNELPDVLAITPEKTSLTFSVESVSENARYEWRINGETAQASKSAAEGGTTFVLTADSKGIRHDLENVLNNLYLVIHLDNAVYSSEEIKFVVSDSASDFDASIDLNIKDSRVASETKKGVQKTIQLKPIYTGSGNFIKAATYESNNEDLATVDDDGLITFHNPTDSTTDYYVTITATSFGGHTDKVTFDVYYVTIPDATSLVNDINGIVYSYMIDARDKKFINDWIGGRGPLGNDTSPSHVTYESSYVTRVNCSGTKNTTRENGYFEFEKGFSQAVENRGNYSIEGSVSIWSDDTSYLGKNDLHVFGHGDLSDIFTIQLPYNQGTATIKYNSVNVHDKTNYGGSYTVTFNNTVGYDGKTGIQDTINHDGSITAIL